MKNQILCAAAALAAGAVTVAADIVHLAPVADNTLYEQADGTLSNGAGTGIFAGANAGGLPRRALTRFDVAGGVPAGATILSATVTLYQASANTGGSPIAAHRLLESWGEGSSVAGGNGGGGAPATTGDATWVHRFFPDQNWSVVGGSFDALADATQVVAGNGYYSWSSAALAASVQGWLDAPASNFGWIFVGNEAASNTAKRFASREEPNADLRPVLAIEYQPVPAPGTLGVLAAGLFAGRRRRAR